jgi:hypothetical protein
VEVDRRRDSLRSQFDNHENNTVAGPGKLEFLQGSQVVSTMNVAVKAGMNRFQWKMRAIGAASPAAVRKWTQTRRGR